MDRFTETRLGRIPELDDEDLENLSNLARWEEPGYVRAPTDYLIGPAFERLRVHGLVRTTDGIDGRGKRIEITDEGRRVLDEWGGP